MCPAFLASLYETQSDLALLLAEKTADLAPETWDAVERELERFCAEPRPLTLEEANQRMRELAELSESWTRLALQHAAGK